MKKNYLFGINLVLIAALCFASCKKESEEINNKLSSVVTVTDCNLNGWVDQLNPITNTTIKFTTGIATPFGKGSLEFDSPSGSLKNFRSTSHHNTLLSSLTAFRYSTFIQSRVNSTDNIFVVLQIDRTGDDLEDDRLLFEPRWQTGSYVAGILRDQGPTVDNIWQTWNLLQAIWWLGPPPRPNPERGGVYFSLASYIGQNPTAKIVNQFIGGGTGGIRFNVGAPPAFPGYWGGEFKGNADAFTIAVNGNATIYDFEHTIANAGNDKHIIASAYGSQCTTLHGSASGGVAPYTYSWSPGGSTPNSANTKVCPTTTTTYKLTVTDAQGCSSSDDVTVYVNDVRWKHNN